MSGTIPQGPGMAPPMAGAGAMSAGNPLMPSGPGPAGPPMAPHQDLAQAHDKLTAIYQTTGKELARAGRFERALSPLVKMGETVTPEDVVSAAGKLVAGGEKPLTLASMLADMPEGPGALAGWLKNHSMALAQQSAELGAVHEHIRHQLGVLSLHALASIGMSPAASGPGDGMDPTQGASPNALLPPPQHGDLG